MEKDSIFIFTDGSSRGNPGPGGWGTIVAESEELSGVKGGKITELGGREAHTTNNRMELVAAIEALEQVQSSKFKVQNYGIRIHSDSRYVINGITKWVKGWIAKDWVTVAKKPVENRDLWEKLYELTEEKTIDWKYVGGHVGVAGNERCDQIATAFADDDTIDLYKGPLSGYSIKNILDISESPALRDEREGGKRSSKAPAYSYVSEVNGEVCTHRTWAECFARVSGKKARFKKATSAGEEAVIKAEFSR